METQRRVLAVYDDAAVFGGHEQMSLHGIEALAEEPDLQLVCFAWPGNEKLWSQLSALAGGRDNLSLAEIDFHSKKLQGLRGRFQGRLVGRMAERLRAEGVEALLALQGDVEASSLGILAAKRARIPAISYIPVPHSLKTMQAKLGGLRDLFNSWLFHEPDSWITISEGLKALLRERGARQPIEVVLNGFDAAKTERRDRGEARRRLGLPDDQVLVAMIGRLEYKQKRQDLLVDCLARHAARLPEMHLVFVGSGPDETNLRARVVANGLSDRVSFIAWTDGLSDVYSAIDVLALPSRYEGVPLVMLEAMSVGLPIVASACDGMAEFLPGEWLFAPGDVDALADRLVSMLAGVDAELLSATRERALTDFSMERFRRSFVAATRSLAGW